MTYVYSLDMPFGIQLSSSSNLLQIGAFFLSGYSITAPISDLFDQINSEQCYAEL